ncbi:hypothetical protein CERSUDRAFT_70031 [Gelatoporia subvermispora B]|uniref:DUF6589 domain-containing protein n=1 Tax=Ceriporiopsis subvermispora (strain B) TaxID=914234 RepID=M2RAP8_CERS8|nr:hypothetical protein CERSUDRAFT_70031 [Gelatoporia subvermispora B]
MSDTENTIYWEETGDLPDGNDKGDVEDKSDVENKNDQGEGADEGNGQDLSTCMLSTQKCRQSVVTLWAVSLPLHDIQCCEESLWSKSPQNPDNYRGVETSSWQKFVQVIVTHDVDSLDMNCCQWFQTWKFLVDLVTYGLEYFQQFKDDLGKPEAAEKIPVVQSKHISLRAMDINEAMTVGNGEALTDIFKQANIDSLGEDRIERRRDIGDYVLLVHGDLATGEQIEGLQRSCSKETTAW